jgi:transposase
MGTRHRRIKAGFSSLRVRLARSAASDAGGHEAVTDGLQERFNKAPEQMRLRWQTVEHPIGTLKAWMGATHFLTKTLARVSTEMSLHVLAYNFKRLLRIIGAELMMKLARA